MRKNEYSNDGLCRPYMEKVERYVIKDNKVRRENFIDFIIFSSNRQHSYQLLLFIPPIYLQ